MIETPHNVTVTFADFAADADLAAEVVPKLVGYSPAAGENSGRLSVTITLNAANVADAAGLTNDLIRERLGFDIASVEVATTRDFDRHHVGGAEG